MRREKLNLLRDVAGLSREKSCQAAKVVFELRGVFVEWTPRSIYYKNFKKLEKFEFLFISPSFLGRGLGSPSCESKFRLGK